MHSESNTTICSSIIHRARHGDDLAWYELVDRYTPHVYRWCRFAGVSADDTKDIIQDVFLRTIRSFNTISRDRSKGESLSAWLYTVTRNCVFDHFRDKRPEINIGDEAAYANSAMEMDDSQLSNTTNTLSTRMIGFCRALDAIRNDVDERTWNAFWRLAVDDESAQSIADDLGISLGAVRQAKYRVVQKLRAEALQFGFA